ncbi:MAG: carboxypeptidase regulatory-like domain-containing protein [Candidatus Accumulibacter sp.]|uniref:Carboxypeptidase regulatory-like domain-containing protein n=1 Tax=Candidatus Accumulibacter affinis TaxID=2954384 RepID=A0A935TBZ6_9PROT|nr:carboxypeptidase regulatory-like domain-containing protein [Candidatus Accumulibacter affinis]
MTAANGNYLFTGLLAGSYMVDVVNGTVPANYQLTTNNDPKPVALAGGEDYLQADFGYEPVSSISGYVYKDAGDDGVWDGTAAGIAGVSLTLTGYDDLGNYVVLNTTTDSDGHYSFTGLRPSDPNLGYTVTEAQPAGYFDGKDTAGSTGGDASVDDVISSIVLPAGVDSINNDFGELPPARISGYVYKDAGNDGVWDGTGAGISGVKLTLTGTNDLGQAVLLEVFSGVDGHYDFVNLRPGTYVVTETQPIGYLDGKDTAGTASSGSTAGSVTGNDVISGITLVAGGSVATNNFGEIVPGGLSGFRYVDLNNNGTRQTPSVETPIQSVTLTLTGTNDLGAITPLTTTSNVNGFYSFGNLRPGTYVVTETQPTAYKDGQDTEDNVTPILGSDATDVITGINVVSGAINPNNNFGELLPATVSGFVYLDANDNGSRAGPPNEPGISGVTVTLTGTDDLGNAVSLTTTTDANGAYSFTGLRPSSPTGYLVTESQPANYVDGKDTAGSTPGSVAGNDVISGIVVGAGGSSANNNFGELLPVSVSGFVYVDSDNDGVKDGGEAGISGVTVTLTGNNDLGIAVSVTATTDSTGAYSFTGLRPSSLFGYTVTETQPAGYLDGKDTAGSTPGSVAGNEVISNIVLLTGGSSSTNNNFGELLGGDVSITKTDGLTTVSPGQTITYTIVASNAGPSAATNALVSDTMPSNLTNVHWTSVATGGASANQLIGTGNINDTVNLVAGSSITYTVTGTLAETVANFATAGTINTSLTQNITVNGVRADAYHNVGGTSYQTTNTVLWERNDDPSDHGIGVVSNGETGSAGGDVNEISHQLNNDVIRLTKADGQQWSSLWVSSLDVNGSGSAETGTFYWSNAATPNLNTLSTKSTFQYGDFGNSVEEGNVLALHPSNFDATAKYLFFVAGPNPAGDNNDYLLWKAATIPTTLTNTATVTGPTGFPDSNPNNNSATDTDVIQKASIGDFVWCDTNGDGLQTVGELGVSGVTVELLNSSNAVVATTTTNSSGSYSFANLDPGDYKVHVVKPAGYQSFTTANQVGSDALDSDVDTTTGITAVTTLVAGENDTSWDAGFKPNVATSITYDFSGSDSATTGSNGNTATHTVSGVSVTANAWSRAQDTGQTWNAAHLGSYGSGNGVTDTSENGSSPNHAVDNSGRDNFVVYRFSEPVTVDKISLGYVDTDSDISVWIGNTTDPVTSMSNAVLASMSVINEENLGGSSTRTADINSGNVSGNTVIVAAKLGNSNDFFKIETMQVKVGVLVTPIAIDLNGNGLDTVALAGSTGKFDLFGNGSEVKSGWLSKDDGFLAIDANHNGKIDGINELFGGNNAGEGFAELIAFDSNGDLVVSASDAHFLDLSVWRDSNGNHKTDAGELMNLTQASVVSLSVDYDSANTFWDAQGNQHLEHSTATLADGHVVDMTDINFAVAANTAATAAAPSALSAGFAFA